MRALCLEPLLGVCVPGLNELILESASTSNFQRPPKRPRSTSKCSPEFVAETMNSDIALSINPVGEHQLYSDLSWFVLHHMPLSMYKVEVSRYGSEDMIHPLEVVRHVCETKFQY